MKKNFILLIFTLFFTFLTIEIFLRFNPKLIDKSLIFYFPGTDVKIKLGKMNKIYSDREIKYLNDGIEKKKIPLIQSTYYRPIEKEDKEFGVTEENYYNQGFCNYSIKEFQEKIISIGDSFTYCTSVNPKQAWIKKIRLSNVSNLQNINYGVPGMGPYEYSRILNSKIDTGVKLVVVAFYEGNDLRDMYNYKYDIKRVSKEDPIYKKLLLITFGKSYFLNYLWATSKSIFLNKIRKNFETINYRFQRKFNKEFFAFNENNYDQSEIIFGNKVLKNEITYNEIQMLWRKPINEMRLTAENNKSKIIFIYIPTAAIAFGKQSIFEDNNTENSIKNLSMVQQKIFNNICNSLDLSCFNLVKQFQAYNYSNKIPSHLPGNLHLTIQGHDLISNFLNDNIKDF